MSLRFAALFPLIAVASACAPMTINVTHDAQALDLSRNAPLPAYIEPLTEVAELELRTQAVGNNTTVAYKDKPFLVQPDALKATTKVVMGHLEKVGHARLGPVANDVGMVQVVRTTISKAAVADSNVTLEMIVSVISCSFMCPFGLLYPAIVPAYAVHHVEGVVQVFSLPAAELNKRLVSVPGQTMPYFNSDGLTPSKTEEFTADVRMEGGLITNMMSTEPTPAAAPLGDALAKEIAATLSKVKTPAATPPALGGV